MPQTSQEEKITDNTTNTRFIARPPWTRLSLIERLPRTLNKAGKWSFPSANSAFVVQEFGFVFRSISIGLSLAGAECELKTLLAASTLKQPFQGMRLGAPIVEVKRPHKKRRKSWLFAFGFTGTIPFSIFTGILLDSGLTRRSKISLALSGLFKIISLQVFSSSLFWLS